MKFDVSNFVNPIKATATAAISYANAHRPEGLIIIGMVGWIGSLYAMYVQSPKIHKDIEDGDIKQVLKDSLPVAGSAVAAAGLQIRGVKEGVDKYAAAYAFGVAAEEALKERKNAEYTALDKKKVDQINYQEAENAVINNPPSDKIVQIGTGTCLHYDKMLKRYFRADCELVNKSLLRMHDAMPKYNCVSISDFYKDLGEEELILGLEDDSLYERLGWWVPEAREKAEIEEWEYPDADFYTVGFPAEPIRVISWKNLQFLVGYGEESIRL